jgi:ATP-binding cassette subfamily B protein
MLMRAVRYGGGWTVALALVGLCGALAELALPAVLGRALDAVLDRTTPGSWLALAVGLVVIAAAADGLGDLASGIGAARATARLRHALVRHVFALEPRTATRYPVGDLTGRLVGQAADAGQAGPAVALGLVGLLPPLGSLVALALIDLWLGVTFVAGLLLLGLLMRAFVTDATAATIGYQRSQGRIAARLVEALAGARTIAAAGTARREVERVLVELPELGRHGARTWLVLAKAAGRSAAVAPLLQLAIVAVGGLGLAQGRLTAGQLVAALQYAALGAGIGAIVATLNSLVRVRAGGRRVAEVLAEPAWEHGDAPLPPGTGRVELCRVTVRAPDGTPLLHGVDLTVPGGTLLAVVGASGAGKSVLAEVVARLRDPDEGRVLLDGVTLPRLRRDPLRRAVGVAFSRPVLVGDTLGEALGLSRAQLRGSCALEAAAVDAFVDRLPRGLDTPLAEAPMSGGEAQRLGLARALAAERLLVLDDVTSNVDTVTEHRVSRALFGRTDARTRIVVTHRSATAGRADAVLWLDGGRVRRLGRHAELWRDPAYRRVFGHA